MSEQHKRWEVKGGRERSQRKWEREEKQMKLKESKRKEMRCRGSKGVKRRREWENIFHSSHSFHFVFLFLFSNHVQYNGKVLKAKLA